MTSTALLTDHYELTMLDAALRSGAAYKSAVFEVFTHRLPAGRDYGVVGGTGRLLDALADFRFGAEEIEFLRARKVVSEDTLAWLSDFRFTGSITGFAEGELFFPNSPILTVESSFAEAVLLETLVLSILNHDSAVAAAANRMVRAADGRALIEMGSRRTHEEAAVASARIAYICGFAATSNLEAGRRYAIPTTGTAAHAFTLAHDDEATAFRIQMETLGTGTTLLVDTYDIATAIDTAVSVAHELGVAGPGAIRIDSGDLVAGTVAARAQLDALGANSTRIVVSNDMDEFTIAEVLAAGAPIDAFGVGTRLVTGSGVPTAELVYKLVAIDGAPVEKRSAEKATHGGRKYASRVDGRDVITLEASSEGRALQIPLVVDGGRVHNASLEETRAQAIIHSGVEQPSS